LKQIQKLFVGLGDPYSFGFSNFTVKGILNVSQPVSIYVDWGSFSRSGDKSKMAYGTD